MPAPLLAAVNDTAYRVVYLLHVISFVVAFAPMTTHALQHVQARAADAPSRSRLRGFMVVNAQRVYAPALILTGVFGMGLVGLSGGAWSFGDPWVSAAFLVWFGMNGVLHAVLLPAERKLAAGEEAAVRRVDAGGGILTVLFVVMLVLMIWKPGA